MKKVLIVEDDASILQTLGTLLDMSGYAYISAENGRVALQKLQNHHNEIDAIVTDIMMPEMNGLELLRHLKENDLFPQIPKIVCSASLDPEITRYLYDHEIPQISKPIDMDQLLSTIAILTA